jgi:hypothetical protein
MYNTAPQTTGLQLSMVRALIDKMEITRQFTTAVFTELLSFFRPVLNNSTFVKSLIHQCFRVSVLPFEHEEYHAHPHFSRPYFSMARLAIKSGDKEKCVRLLLQCRVAIQSKGYATYDLGEALADEDFRKIRDQLH